MTQPSLTFTPALQPSFDSGIALTQADRPVSLCEALAAHFQARPGKWIDGMTLATVAGQYAWRSRVSDLRKRGMVIKNRQRVQREHESGCPLLQFWDATDEGAHCTCDTLRTFTISEYMFVPEGK